jgi:hypothetical protein
MSATEAEIVGMALKGRRNGRSWLCRCPAHDDRTPSLSVGTGRNERLLLHCHAGCEPRDVFTELRRMGILEGRRQSPMPPRHKRAIETLPPADAAEDADRRRRIEMAQRVWSQTEDILFTLGERYLTEERGIMLTRDPGAVPYLLDRVRWHPCCPVRRDSAPAIVCPITSPTTGCVSGVWRIVLDEHGRRTERLGLGNCRGGAVRLDPALEGDEIAITEGIEDGLAWMQLMGSPAWAALSTSGVAGIVLPPRFRRVTVVADRDEWKARRNGTRYRPGIDAARKLAARMGTEGRHVRIIYPSSADTKDCNDVLQAAVPA